MCAITAAQKKMKLNDDHITQLVCMLSVLSLSSPVQVVNTFLSKQPGLAGGGGDLSEHTDFIRFALAFGGHAFMGMGGMAAVYSFMEYVRTHDTAKPWAKAHAPNIPPSGHSADNLDQISKLPHTTNVRELLKTELEGTVFMDKSVPMSDRKARLEKFLREWIVTCTLSSSGPAAGGAAPSAEQGLISFVADSTGVPLFTTASKRPIDSSASASAESAPKRARMDIGCDGAPAPADHCAPHDENVQDEIVPNNDSDEEQADETTVGAQPLYASVSPGTTAALAPPATGAWAGIGLPYERRRAPPSASAAAPLPKPNDARVDRTAAYPPPTHYKVQAIPLQRTWISCIMHAALYAFGVCLFCVFEGHVVLFAFNFAAAAWYITVAMLVAFFMDVRTSPRNWAQCRLCVRRARRFIGAAQGNWNNMRITASNIRIS